MNRQYRYFLYVTLAGERIEREVSLEEFCKAERAAGFRPKLWSGDPAYMRTPATGGFGSGDAGGRVEYVSQASQVQGFGKVVGTLAREHGAKIDWPVLPESDPQPWDNVPGRCWCRTCRPPITPQDMRMVLCPQCGNKRCPHANDHRNACTGSNEPGQPGSAYPKVFE